MQMIQRGAMVLVLLTVTTTIPHAQEIEERTWELVRAFEEITYEPTRAGTPINPVGGFVLDTSGDLFLYEVQEGLLHRYDVESGYQDRTTWETISIPFGDVSEGRYVDGWLYFQGNGTAVLFSPLPDGTWSAKDLRYGNIRREHGVSFPGWIPYGDFIFAGGPDSYFAIELFLEDPDRDPEYRSPAETMALVRERGEELGLYFDDEGYLWVREDPHDWLLTTSASTFTEVFDLSRETRASGDFMGRDRLGNYYWGSMPGFILERSSRPRTSRTQGRVNLDGEVMFFAYNGEPYDWERERIDLYRVDTGIVTGN